MLKFSFHHTCLNAVAFSPDGSRLAAGGSSGRVREWTLNPAAEERTVIATGLDMVRTLAYAPDGVLLVRADQKLHAFGPGGEALGTRPPDVRVHVNRIALAGMHPGLAVAHPDSVVLYRLSDFKPVWTAACPTAGTALASTPNASTVALGEGDGRVRLFRDGRELPISLNATVEVKAVALSPSGDAVAACAGRHLWLWRLTPGPREVGHVQLGRTHFHGVAWHPSGAFLATTNGDGTVDYWDALTGARRESFAWKAGKLHDITFDAGGDRAACCSLRGKVVVWDVDR